VHLWDKAAAGIGTGWLLEDDVEVGRVEELTDQGAAALLRFEGKFFVVFLVGGIEDDVEACFLAGHGISPW